MTAPSFNYFYRVDVKVIKLVLGGIKNDRLNVRELETRTYKFVNKELRDAITPADRETMFPILDSIGEITLAAGEILPTASLSQISIDNSRGSFGPDRKFSDLLQRYSPINQEVTFYIGSSDNNVDAPTSWTQIGVGKISSWSVALNADRQSLNFQIAPFKISDKVMNLEVSRDVHGMESAPDSSLGKALPIVFNKPDITSTDLDTYPQVIPTRITADGSENAKYAVATQMYHVTKSSSPNKFYVEKGWDDTGSTWAQIDKTVTAPDYYSSLAGTYYSLNTWASIAWKIPNLSSSAMLLGGVELKALGQGSAARNSTGYLSVYILRVDKITKAVVEEMTRGRIALATYNTQNNVPGTTFIVKVSFDQPIVIEPGIHADYDFYIGFEGTGITAGDMVLYKYAPASPTTYSVLRKNTSAAAGDSYTEWGITTDSNFLAHKFRFITATFEPHVEYFTKDGFTYSRFSLSQSAPDTAQVNPALDSLRLVIPCEGFYSYAGTAIYDPPTVISLLSYEWDGEVWNDANAIDTTTLNSSHYEKLFAANGSHRARYLSGVIETKSTYQNVLLEIAKGTASKIGIQEDGQLFMYPWGVTVEPAFHIPQADIIPLSWDNRDDSTIINRTVITAGKVYAVNQSQDSGDGYAISIDYSSGDYRAVSAMTEESFSFYGVKNIVENKFNVYGFSDVGANVGVPGYLTGEATPSQPSEAGVITYSVDFLADYYMSRFALPSVYVSFVVPYHRYSSIKMFDVITFAHSDFPCFYGADPSPRAGVVETSGGTVAFVPNANNGEELVRAQTYRGLVEAVSTVLAMEHAPAIRLTVQVLFNRAYDPT